HAIEVPSAMVEAEADRRLEGIVREMIAEGEEPQKAQVDWAEERARLVPAATRAVRAMLVLEGIAAQEGLEATEDDVNEHLKAEARRHNVSVSDLKTQIAQNAGLAGL